MHLNLPEMQIWISTKQLLDVTHVNLDLNHQDKITL